MAIGNTKLHPKKLVLCLGMVCSVLSVITPDTVSSQTTPVIRILRVSAAGGTSFKQQGNWYRQSPQIPNGQKCPVKQNEKFFVSSIKDNKNSTVEYRDGNRVERLKDYFEVTFDQPVPCEGKESWFIFKAHVQQLRTVVVP
jgi:hypothetical protein